MRLVVGTLALVLASSLALAEDAPKPAEAPIAAPIGVPGAAPVAPVARTKVPVRVVRILADTNQALLFDRTSGGTYLLVTVGEKVGIYTVEAIDDDEVTLSSGDQKQLQVVLAAPDASWRRRRAAGLDPSPATAGAKPADPYEAVAITGAPAAAAANAPVDPYAPEEVREVKAPAEVRSASAGDAASLGANPFTASTPGTLSDPYASPAPTAPGTLSDPYANTLGSNPFAASAPATAAPAPAPTPGALSDPYAPDDLAGNPYAVPPVLAPAPVAPVGDPILSRAEVDAALANFGALTVAFHASFTAAGVRIDGVLDGSLFARAGLRAGDVITAIDGKPLRSLDDVASLYARASTVRALTAQILRNGKPTSLRLSIR